MEREIDLEKRTKETEKKREKDCCRLEAGMRVKLLPFPVYLFGSSVNDSALCNLTE
ncbi:hypothetical protein FH972_001481 [Carpinus fangiana]|uniref:Uncharacterized protein n=1 Tax=Carpinus fangiana TaxID=176857 RepID=A0A5N6QF38_9ROSI|nr:hypothetical protein FH972_001481 [Carpinus fangiana]